MSGYLGSASIEYAVPLWSPYLQKNIDALERVQRSFSVRRNSDNAWVVQSSIKEV